MLADRELGGEIGEDENDVTSLRQVIAFLEDFARRFPS
jgi:hypothetical protein